MVRTYDKKFYCNNVLLVTAVVGWCGGRSSDTSRTESRTSCAVATGASPARGGHNFVLPSSACMAGFYSANCKTAMPVSFRGTPNLLTSMGCQSYMKNTMQRSHPTLQVISYTGGMGVNIGEDGARGRYMQFEVPDFIQQCRHNVK